MGGMNFRERSQKNQTSSAVRRCASSMPLSFDYAETYPRKADVQIQEGYNLGIYPKMFSTDFIIRQPEMSGWIQVAMQQNTIVLYVHNNSIPLYISNAFKSATF